MLVCTTFSKAGQNVHYGRFVLVGKAFCSYPGTRRPFMKILFFIDHNISFNLFINVIVVMCNIDKHLLLAPKSNFMCFYLELQVGFSLNGGRFAPGYPNWHSGLCFNASHGIPQCSAYDDGECDTCELYSFYISQQRLEI